MKNLRKTKYGMECDQNWDSMTVIKHNCRQCELCNKPVTDFTSWSREALEEYYKQHPKACGIFMTDQLDKPINVRSPIQTMRALAGIVSVFFISNFKAQERPKQEVKIEQHINGCKSVSSFDSTCTIIVKQKVFISQVASDDKAVQNIKRSKYFFSWRFPFIHKKRKLMGKRMRIMGCPSF